MFNLKMEIELRLRTGREDGDRKWQRKSSWRLWQVRSDNSSGVQTKYIEKDWGSRNELSTLT